MIEVLCTLRCDRCKEAVPTVAEAQHVSIGPNSDMDQVRAFVVTDQALLKGWRVVFDELRCPRCNGVK